MWRKIIVREFWWRLRMELRIWRLRRKVLRGKQ